MKYKIITKNLETKVVTADCFYTIGEYRFFNEKRNTRQCKFLWFKWEEVDATEEFVAMFVKDEVLSIEVSKSK